MINAINYNPTTQPTNTRKLSIFYYNDTHGNSDQIAGVAHAAKEFKRKNLNNNTDSFVLSAGDNYSGGDTQKNAFIIDLMQNFMGVDLSAIGNHEIDGKSKGLYDIIKDKKVQFVATNAVLSKDNPLEGVIKKSIIKEQNGIKYGFIGTMPIDFKTCTKKEVQKDISVADLEETIAALQKEIDSLKAQKIDKIILLSHSGYEKDKEYARNLDGVDIIVGGHTHTVVEGAKNNENIVKSKSGEPVLIVQAGENGKYYGILNVEFDEKGILKTVQNTLKSSLHLEKSPILEYIKEKFTGKSPQIATISEIEPMPQNRRIAPCAWTNAMVDAMKSELGTQIALINSANTRKVPRIGKLTEKDVVESTPMKNKLIKTKISQKQLIDAIKAALNRTFSNKDGVPGIIVTSGLSYKADDKGNLLEASFIENDGKKTPIDINNPSKDIIYSVACDDFISQKDGEYPELFPQYEVENFDFDKDLTFINHIKKLDKKDGLKFIDDKRIEIQKTSQQIQPNNSNQNFLNLFFPKAS